MKPEDEATGPSQSPAGEAWSDDDDAKMDAAIRDLVVAFEPYWMIGRADGGGFEDYMYLNAGSGPTPDWDQTLCDIRENWPSDADDHYVAFQVISVESESRYSYWCHNCGDEWNSPHFGETTEHLGEDLCTRCYSNAEHKPPTDQP